MWYGIDPIDPKSLSIDVVLVVVTTAAAAAAYITNSGGDNKDGVSPMWNKLTSEPLLSLVRGNCSSGRI